jgi:hypothetical protein
MIERVGRHGDDIHPLPKPHFPLHSPLRSPSLSPFHIPFPYPPFRENPKGKHPALALTSVIVTLGWEESRLAGKVCILRICLGAVGYIELRTKIGIGKGRMEILMVCTGRWGTNGSEVGDVVAFDASFRAVGLVVGSTSSSSSGM